MDARGCNKNRVIYLETHSSSQRADDNKESFCGDKSSNPGAREEEQVVQRHTAHVVQVCQSAAHSRCGQQHSRDADEAEEQIGDGQRGQTDERRTLRRSPQPRPRVAAGPLRRPGPLGRRWGRQDAAGQPPLTGDGEPTKNDDVADGAERQDDWDDDTIDVVADDLVRLQVIVCDDWRTCSVVGERTVKVLVTINHCIVTRLHTCSDVTVDYWADITGSGGVGERYRVMPPIVPISWGSGPTVCGGLAPILRVYQYGNTVCHKNWGLTGSIFVAGAVPAWLHFRTPWLRPKKVR